jgi:hypothetical protein
MTPEPPIPPLLRPRTQLVALAAGGAGLLLCAIGLIFDRESVFRSYLFAFVFVNSIPLGCLAVVMLHHLTGGGWGVPVRRLAEAGAMTAPLMAVLFLPIAAAMLAGHLYPWANPGEYAKDAVLRHRRELPVLGFSAGWVLARAVVYFVVWCLLAWRLRAISLARDGMVNPDNSGRLRSLSAGGTVLYFVTASLAAADWVMSREAHYQSSVFGFIAIAGQSVAGLCFVLVVLALLTGMPELDAAAKPKPLHDLGNLLLTCVVLWAYVSFAQLLVNWTGNTQEDVTWYVHRSHGGWRVVTIALVVLHFFVPFVLLLFQPAKRNLRPLARLAAGLLFLRLVDALWAVAPSSPTEHAGRVYWTDLAAPIGVGGVWLAGFLWVLKRRPLVVSAVVEVVPGPSLGSPEALSRG